MKREIGAVIFTRTRTPSSFDLRFPSPTANRGLHLHSNPCKQRRRRWSKQRRRSKPEHISLLHLSSPSPPSISFLSSNLQLGGGRFRSSSHRDCKESDIGGEHP
ncbi:hypothetical protein LXL04_038291 [Taraxacum kok-saghyz]